MDVFSLNGFRYSLYIGAIGFVSVGVPYISNGKDKTDLFDWQMSTICFVKVNGHQKILRSMKNQVVQPLGTPFQVSYLVNDSSFCWIRG